MVLNDRPLKKAKKTVTVDIYDFLTFPAEGDVDSGDGSFLSKVRSLLKKHGRPAFTPSLFPRLLSWQILLKIGDLGSGGSGSSDSSPPLVALDVVEEDVTRSASVYCDQCRVVGWSNHPVCSKRYHFIIRADPNPLENYQKQCSTCGNFLHLLEPRCKSCGSEISTDDIEDWVYLQFEDTSHLLHGVVHSNGYGHLLRVNGKEGGSKLLSGCHIMNFWDRLCETIAVRKVSVMDVSKKYGMEYRLLHGIIKGHSWYGEWGYEFGSGSYALTQEAYLKAVESLSSLPLSCFLFQGRRPRSQLQSVIAFYQSLSDSQLATLKDLLAFLIKLIQETQRPLLPDGEFSASTSKVLCAWTCDDVELVQQAMIKVLLAAGESNWVTRRCLKGALCKLATLELLDYCLKYLQGKLAGNGMVVQSRCNSISSVVEFRLEPQMSVLNASGFDSSHPRKEHIVRDLNFLYDSIVNPQTMLSYRPLATRQLVADSAAKLLDCKQFVKDYKPDRLAVANPFVVKLWCRMELGDHPKEEVVPPPELLLLTQSATVADLKTEASSVFREVYPIFSKFQAEELLDYGPVEDSMTLKVLVGLSGSVRVRGRCPGLQALNHFRMERGTEIWTVDCMCGAKDDDGERMLACDKCGVWLHTRCAGIGSFDAIPAKFVCVRCLNSYSKDLDITPSSEEAKTLSGSNCRNEAVATNGTSLTMTNLSFDIR